MVEISKIELILVVVLFLIVGFLFGNTIGVEDAFKNGAEAQQNYTLNILNTASTFKSCSATWTYCKASNFYEPILQFFVNITKNNSNSVFIKFRYGDYIEIGEMGGNTRSMSPTIEPGYTILIQKNPNNLKIGDILQFPSALCQEYHGTYDNLIHRYIGNNIINGTVYLVTKGDNNYINDTCQIEEKDVLGRIVAIFPSKQYE